MVKDVCRQCNSGQLARLDAYGKQFYDRYFASVIYDGETLDFEYDGDKLIRWLLKLSFNSSRAQNADVKILRKLRRAILGKAALTDHVRCWLDILPPTFLAGPSDARPAVHGDQNKPELFEPLWFRITRLRLSFEPAASLVQRQALINSFAFTLLIAPPSSALGAGSGVSVAAR